MSPIRAPSFQKYHFDGFDFNPKHHYLLPSGLTIENRGFIYSVGHRNTKSHNSTRLEPGVVILTLSISQPEEVTDIKALKINS